MVSWRECKSLLKLRDQVNALWPNRDKASDGTAGDLAHSQRKSDHNPNAAGVVTAWDCDRELGGQPEGSNDGPTVAILVAKLQASKDPRIKYLIWNAQITVKGDISRWKPYTGANAHKHHCHISVSADPHLYDDDSDWNLTASPQPTQPVQAVPVNLALGSKGEAVKSLQEALAGHGFAVTIDGDFGPNTQKAVKAFQAAFHLRPDGIAGPNTMKELGL
jgi:murein L,D-transpeptidase YcbB/YkuD